MALVGVIILPGDDAVAQDTVAGEFHRLVDMIEDDSQRAERLAAAHLIGELRPYMVSEEFSAPLREAADATGDSLVNFVIDRQVARADLEGKGELSDRDGRSFSELHSCVVDWELVGPFPNASMQGFDERFGPELGKDGPYTGRSTDIDWRPLSSTHHLCAYQLDSRVHPSTSAVVYLATTLEMEESQRATLLVGAKSAYRIWVNGEPVGQREAALGFGLDAEGWSVELTEGDNEVLVKLASPGDGGLSWIMRVVDELDETALQGWRARPGIERRSTARFQPVGMPDAGARAVIEEAVKPEQTSSTQLAGALLWMRLYDDDSNTPWRDVADRLLEQHQELSSRQLLWLARLYEEHWQRQAVLTLAADRDGDDPLVARKRAVERGNTLSHLEWEQQRRELASLVAQEPEFLMAVLSLTRWFHEHEGAGRALRALDEFNADDREVIPAWIRKAAELSDAVGDDRRASRLRRKAANVHQLSGTFGWNLIAEAMAIGDLETAQTLAGQYRHRAPWAQRWGLQEAMLLRASGDVARAIEVLDTLIAEAPGNASLLQRRAELLLLNGDVDGAKRAVQRAITLRPQAIRYQEFLEHLQPESSRFYQPWVVTQLRELADETPSGSQTYDFIVDQRIQQVASNGLARRFEQRAHRVLRDEGINQARQMRVSYTPGDERVEVLGVRVYKADGSISEDYDDWATSRTRQSARMYNDRGFVSMRANNVDVGDVVEFRYVVHQVANENFRGDYFGDVRHVERTRPVAFSRYALLYPTDWNLYFRPPQREHQRVDGKLPDGTAVTDQRLTSFELRDIPRVFTEDNQPGSTDVYDHILVSNKQTYDEIGLWWWELISEQLVVDDAIRDAVNEVTQGLESDNEKLEAIYEYVVRNTRYLHLGLGIHGWKPYRTSTVFRNRYGDCKDKAALLKVMLEEAGIEAEMVLVRTRRLGSVDDFPASMHIFNHAVTYVPSLDLFLDPTARFNGPYELTQMDQGAQALIVRDGGATEWVRMPIDQGEANLQRERFEVDLRQEMPMISGVIEAHGANAVRDRQRLEDAERRDERFEDRLRRQISGLELLDAEYEDLDRLTVPTRIRFSAQAPGILRGGDGAMSLYPYLTARELLDSYARQSERRQDLTFRVPFVRQAEVRYRLPEQVMVERIPEPTQMTSPFGEFGIEYRHEDDELIVDLRYAIEVQRVAVDDYPDFRRFIASMDAALDETIRLIDEENGR